MNISVTSGFISSVCAQYCERKICIVKNYNKTKIKSQRSLLCGYLTLPSLLLKLRALVFSSHTTRRALTTLILLWLFMWNITLPQYKTQLSC